MATTNRIEKPAGLLRRLLRDSMTPEGIVLSRHLIPLLADGRPVPVERLARELGRSSAIVTAQLRQSPIIEWDKRSPEAASQWLTQHPGATIVPVIEAYQIGHHLAQSVFQAPCETPKELQ